MELMRIGPLELVIICVIGVVVVAAVVGLVFLILWLVRRGSSPATPPVAVSSPYPPAGMKKCPYCAEYIQQEAVVCRYCGREQPPVSPQM